jgi:hypothetical protein
VSVKLICTGDIQSRVRPGPRAGPQAQADSMIRVMITGNLKSRSRSGATDPSLLSHWQSLKLEFRVRGP